MSARSLGQTYTDGFRVRGRVTDEEWDIANEHASHIHACYAANPNCESKSESKIETYRRNAITGIAFANTAALLYDDEEWEWPYDFRDNPRIDPTDSANEWNPIQPYESMTKFIVGENTITVSLFLDEELTLCSSPMDFLFASGDATVHVKGSIDEDWSFFSFYGARTPEMCLNEIPYFLSGEFKSSNEISDGMTQGEPFENQIPLSQLTKLSEQRGTETARPPPLRGL
jgi:hypothetical protein